MIPDLHQKNQIQHLAQNFIQSSNCEASVCICRLGVESARNLVSFWKGNTRQFYDYM